MQKFVTILVVAASLSVSASALMIDTDAPLYTGSILASGPLVSEGTQLDSEAIQEDVVIPSVPASPAAPTERAAGLLAAYEPTPEIESFVTRPLHFFSLFPGQTVVASSVEKAPPAAPAIEHEARRPAPERPPVRVQRQVRTSIIRISFTSSVLGPMAHTRFCLDFPSDCKVPKLQFRSSLVKMTLARRAELAKINTKVNQTIRPEPNTEGLAGEKWLIAPEAGDCNDYAVTKRHELIARGWPLRALLLAEVVVASGEHHLVLVVRTNEGDLVADNLNSNIRNWSKVGYEWVRIQTPANPIYWAKIARTTV